MIWELPQEAEVGGRKYPLVTDFRNVLKILSAFEDPDLSQMEKQYICLRNLYSDFSQVPPSEYEAAYAAAIRFIDAGEEKQGNGPRTMDWTQDAPLLFPAVNKVAGYEVRSCEYLHWWTFLGFFMEIRDSVYASVLTLRQKKARHKKLEKWEKEYWSNNRKICELAPKLTSEEKEEKERLNALLQPVK